ncbi:MAG TPA: hypothetical protein VKS24_22310 [Bradyrhizobium sp.]|nr:hypothetical protein [Bradyrhizobium sp.]
MKKIILSALVISSSLAFANAPLYAAQNDDIAARVQALEKENAAIKKELTARRESKAAREQKAALRPTSRPQAGAVESAPASGKQLPAMDITHQDLGIGYPDYHSGFGGPYGDGNYPQ